MKTLHAVPCKVCNRRSVTHGGWCPMCLVRGVKSMQAMSTPLMVFLMESGAVTPGDKMPYGDELLAMLRGIRDAKEKETPVAAVRVRDDLDHQAGTPDPGNRPVDPPDHPCGAPGGADQ
jgi:hypothetical protein